MLRLSRYQWTVLFAAWLGWGFDVFDGLIASLGIGGEWAAGGSMVAEVMPEKSRVEAAALLYTSAPMGLFLATFINSQIAGVLLPGSPEISWRYIFLCGLIPAAIAFLVDGQQPLPQYS